MSAPLDIAASFLESVDASAVLLGRFPLFVDVTADSVVVVVGDFLRPRRVVVEELELVEGLSVMEDLVDSNMRHFRVLMVKIGKLSENLRLACRFRAKEWE